MLLKEYCFNNKKTIPGSLSPTYPDVKDMQSRVRNDPEWSGITPEWKGVDNKSGGTTLVSACALCLNRRWILKT